ncbi:MAG: hypothetical protein HC906_15765 [Bacteroidales bacterium]|nr:hypothetical protein [Bacteroidales bacterium]
MFGEGGILLGYTLNPDSKFHFGGSLQMGYLSMVADDEEMELFKDIDDDVLEDNAAVYHPGLFGEVNLTRYAKFKLGVGYSFFLFDEENIICNKTLDSWTLDFGLYFGNFTK